MQKTIIQNRITDLRQAMQTHGIDALIVPSADPHLSEYLPEYWQARQWLSGFTGSAGTLVVTATEAGLWADSRYWVQADNELADTGIELQKLQTGNSHVDWLKQWVKQQLSNKDEVVIALDGNVLSVAEQTRLQTAFNGYAVTLKTDVDVLSEIWQDRPALPTAPIYAHDAKFVSQSARDKLRAVREHMAEQNATHHLISSLDDVAWLTNLRGNDVDYNPVFLAYVLIDEDKATLFVDTQKISKDVQALLDDAGFNVADYADVKTALDKLSAEDTLLIDPSRVAVGTLAKVSENVTIIEKTNPSTMLKAVKSPDDIEHIREAMRQDGVALCEFFAEFERRLADGERLSELDVDEMLIDARSAQPNYVSPSFPTIAGFNANGALPHYRALPDNFSYLDGDGLLLIDSGGQYQNGTTDITRMVVIGQVSDAQKPDVTRVLQAHIALAEAHFPEGIPAPNLDAICRAPLWRHGLDYGHGTGHGVGYFLNVHEGPQAISHNADRKNRELRAGMLTSNEPGLYREGKWGIRIENLVVNQVVNHKNDVDNEFGDYLCFETVTLCPIDTRLLDIDLLTEAEKAWLNGYHTKVYHELKGRMSDEALAWLEARTQAI